MRVFKEHKGLLVNAAVWSGIFLTEVFLAFWETSSTPRPDFTVFFLRRFFLPTLPFVALFAAHDLLVAPMLIRGKRVLSYFLCMTAMMGAFSFYILDSDGIFRKAPGPAPMMPMRGEERHEPPKRPEFMDESSGSPEFRPKGRPRQDKMPVGASVSKIVIALLMLGINLGSKYYSNSSMEKKRLDELEKENLRYRLEYLRYQINPHFFMNTLNNIHALVDVSPEKAKDSIVELSRLMRHVLYDSNDPVVGLSKEIEFLRHYLYLMRLRYTDGVRIENTFPDDDCGAQVPPLLMATITENAFKHGVSYKSDCYVRLSVAVESGKVIFRCANSTRTENEGRQEGGVGLDNIRKRLSLLYGEDYVLHIEKSASGYEVLMILPSKPALLC